MSTFKKAKADGQEQQVHKVRITLSSRNPKNLEAVCNSLMTRSRDQNVKVKGPVRLPTRYLRITTRQSPCGNGTNSWDRFQMAIHKRLIDMYAAEETVKNVTSINIEAGVEIEVVVTDA